MSNTIRSYGKVDFTDYRVREFAANQTPSTIEAFGGQTNFVASHTNGGQQGFMHERGFIGHDTNSSASTVNTAFFNLVSESYVIEIENGRVIGLNLADGINPFLKTLVLAMQYWNSALGHNFDLTNATSKQMLVLVNEVRNRGIPDFLFES